MTSLMLLATIVLHSAQPAAPGYLPPGTPATGGDRNICLIYHGKTLRPAWTETSLLPYVACVDSANKPTDWLFDSFLFIEYETDEGRQLCYYEKSKPQPTVADWQWLAGGWFRPDSGVNGLEKCVAEVGRSLGQPDHRVNVVVTMPVPLNEITEFGALPGTDRPLNFSSAEDQQAAMRWYVDTVRAQFEEGKYPHLNLLGFYWLGESVMNKHDAIIRWTSEYLHANGLKHYWIPYFTGAGAGQWRAFGFDAMMLQPNYFFEGHGGIRRLYAAAERAKRFGCGVEMEFDARALSSEEHQQRYWDYLDAGAAYGWMKGAMVGWYEGGGALGKLMQQQEKGRPMYEAICQFVKGTYVPRHPERLPAPEELPVRSDDNLALASKGAKVIGAINDGQPGLEPERMIDGDTYNYSGSSGLTWFVIPGNITIQLPVSSVISRIQMLLFDLDDRYYSYRIETSTDGKTWESAVDKSTVQARGWQVDRFPPRTAQFIRLTGLTNSTGQNLMQIIELEAYTN